MYRAGLRRRRPLPLTVVEHAGERVDERGVVDDPAPPHVHLNSHGPDHCSTRARRRPVLASVASPVADSAVTKVRPRGVERANRGRLPLDCRRRPADGRHASVAQLDRARAF